MELILLAVGAIVWIVLKALSQPPPKPPPPRQRSIQPTESSGSVSFSQPKPMEPVVEYYEGAPLELEELDDEAGSAQFELSKDNLIQGIIMAEVLQPPRGRRPHRLHR